VTDPKDEPFLDDPEAEEIEDMVEEEATASPDDDDARERQELHDRLMRALADAENVRKRAARERREAEAYGATRLARDLLPIYDNLERALLAVGEDESALGEGLELTLRELLNVFERHGITKIAPAKGDRFDPQHHQAMFEAPVPGTVAGEILEVMAQGFLLHGRLLRPAQVGVSSMAA
jgi:molecular chaperone GrpE